MRRFVTGATMDDSHFGWWSFDGQRQEAPITYFQVLDHVRLERVEMCELIDSDGMSLSRPKIQSDP
jgi:hypothetical protein